MNLRWTESALRPLALAAACSLVLAAYAHPGSGLAADSFGKVHFLDTGSGLWTLDPAAHAAPVKRSPKMFHWLAIDSNDRFANTRLPADSNSEVIKVGKSPTILLSSDYPLTVGTDGNLYFPSGSPEHTHIARLTPDGKTSIFARLPKDSGVPHIDGLAPGPDGDLYYTDAATIRRVSRTGTVSTIATIAPGPRDPKIPDVDRRPYLRGLTVDAQGVVYVADTSDARVLKITPAPSSGGAPTVTTILQLESPWSPTAVAIRADTLYVQEYLHTAGDNRREWLPRIRAITPPTPDGASTIVATVNTMPGAR